MVLAGAGSGKTRVLVHRVAWLIAIDKVPLQNIFVVTFTNKAATEMRKRIEDILNYPTKSFWIGTFHGLAHKFLRIHWEEAGLDKNFQIMDSLDQIRMIKKMLKALNKSESDFSPKDIQLFINKNKDAGLRAAYVGTKNYDIGVYLAQIVMMLKPNGGEICIQSGGAAAARAPRSR